MKFRNDLFNIFIEQIVLIVHICYLKKQNKIKKKINKIQFLLKKFQFQFLLYD